MNTFFALLAEHGTAQIPLERVCSLFGLSPKEANVRAKRQELPVPAFRVGSQQSPWLIDAGQLAAFLDAAKSKAADEWRRIQQAA